jgi:DNA-binding transcriptional regulator YiaG
MNIQDMGRLLAEQERLLRQMQPAFETARQLWRQVQPAVDLVRQHAESFRRIAAGSEAAADACRVAGLEESLAGWRTALSRDVARFPPTELARLEEVAAAVRQSMRTVPTLAPEMLGGAWNERLADAAAHLQERAERLASAPDAGAPEDVESLAGDIEAVTAVTPAEAQERVSRWLVLVLCFVLDALALDPAKEILREAVAKLLVVLLVTAAEATVPTPPLPPTSAAPETGAEATIEDARETTRGAISELRRIGGLTWAELGQLFGASPQSIHSWASGRTLDAVTEQHLLRLLDRDTPRRPR